MGMGPSWSMDRDHFSNLPFPCPKEAPNEIWAKLARRLQRWSRLKFSTFFPYKCRRKQTWPHHKKVKCQCTTIIIPIGRPPILMISRVFKLQSWQEINFENKTKGDNCKRKESLSCHSSMWCVISSCSAFLPSIIKMFWRVFNLQSPKHNHCQIYITMGDNAKSKKGRVVLLVHNKLSRSVLHFYQVPSKYSEGYSSYRADEIYFKQNKGRYM